MNLFITDYKQARKVKSSKVISNEEVKHSANKGILNKFSSVNLHLGLPPSKKDDLESLGYILVYFFKKGFLFEKNSKVITKEEKFKYYEQQKLGLIPETFCQNLPQEMGAYMSYIKLMQTNQANEKIDYDYLRKLFRNLFNRNGTMENFQYDWIEKARTYNLDPNVGQKSDNDNNVSNMYIRTEILTFQSSKFPESEANTERENAHKESISLSPRDMQRYDNEYDFFDVDEFSANSAQSIPFKMKKIEVFQEMVKTKQHVQNTTLINKLLVDPFLQRRCQSDKSEQDTTKEDTMYLSPSSDKNPEYSRTKMRSATEVNKISKFGMASILNNNKSFQLS
jgi:hypothetical protein